jgi:protein TonB
MIRQPRPVYLKEAKAEHIEGVVHLAILISKNGDVSELHLISGNPVLVPAAIKAVKRWKYSPFLLNGLPVETKTQVDVSFNLSQ